MPVHSHLVPGTFALNYITSPRFVPYYEPLKKFVVSHEALAEWRPNLLLDSRSLSCY
ncbi:MAG: hypothetical protein N3B10_11070 [Armatimonadetes bacterium]|nr:hypothetical protein [Armatimonadota bacterium]